MELDDRTTALVIARARVVVGAVMVMLPGIAGRMMVGRAGRDAKAVVRMLGARDIVLGVGAITTVKEQTQDAEWVGMGAFADGADAVALFLGPGPRGRRMFGALTAAAAAVPGMLVARRLAGMRR